MKRRCRTWVLMCSCLAMASMPVGCDFGKDKTVVPLVQEPGAAPDPHALKRAKRDGPSLFWKEHSLELAVARGLPRAGATVNKVLLPISEVDREFHSSSVTFYRWPKLEPGQKMTGGGAQRWLVVPMLLRPDRVLENEQFNNYLEDTSDRAREVDAVVMVGATLLDEYPSGRWHMHPVREGTEKNPDRRVRTRVYAMAADGSGPDIEVVVADATRISSHEIVAKTLVHEIGHWHGETLQMQLNAPTAMTVARVLEKQALARQFIAIGADESQWSIDAETGAIEALTPDADALEDESPPLPPQGDLPLPPPSGTVAESTTATVPTAAFK